MKLTSCVPKNCVLRNYVLKTAALAMLAGIGGLLLLQMVFAYLGEIDSLSPEYTFVQAFWYIVYRAPYFFGQFMATGVLLGAVVGLGLLAVNSEIVVMRAAGISLYRIIGWTMLPATLIALGALCVNQWLLPYSNTQAKQIKHPTARMLALQGYWTVLDNANERTVMHIATADIAGNLTGVRRYQLQDGQLISALEADSAVWLDGYEWQLQNVARADFTGTVTTTHFPTQVITLPIDKSAVYLLTKDADDLSISELYAHDKLMHHQGKVSKRHRLAFWQKLLSPLSVLSLLLVACSFVFGSLRSQSMGFRVVLALLTGLLFSYLQDLSGFVALATGISPLMMVLLPIVVSVGVGIWLLNKKA